MILNSILRVLKTPGFIIIKDGLGVVETDTQQVKRLIEDNPSLGKSEIGGIEISSCNNIKTGYRFIYKINCR